MSAWRRRGPRGSLLAMVVAGLLVAASCSESGGVASSPIEELVALIPEDDVVYVAAADLVAWEAAEQASPCSGEEDVIDQLGFYAAHFFVDAELNDTFGEFAGFRRCDVTAIANVVVDAQLATMYRTTADDGTIRDTLNAQTATERRGDGATEHFAWDASEIDFAELGFPSGGAMAVRDGTVFQSSDVERVTGLLDGGGARLLDRPGTSEALEELIDLGAHSIALLPQAPFTVDEVVELADSPEEADTVRAMAEAGPILGPYRVAATGAGSDEVGRFGLIVFNHSTEAEAELNLERLRALMLEGRSVHRQDETWGELLEDWEIELNGDHVVLRFRIDFGLSHTHPIIHFYLSHDSLFWIDQ